MSSAILCRALCAAKLSLMLHTRLAVRTDQVIYQGLLHRPGVFGVYRTACMSGCNCAPMRKNAAIFMIGVAFAPFAVLLHECGHYLVGRSLGMSASFHFADITLPAQPGLTTHSAMMVGAGGPLVDVLSAVGGKTCRPAHTILAACLPARCGRSLFQETKAQLATLRCHAAC